MAVEVAALDAGLGGVEVRAARDGVWPTVAAVAGGVFLAALLAGSVLAPAGPAPLAPRLQVHQYFVAHLQSALLQSYVVHGLAGAALVVLAVALRRSFADVPRSRVARGVLLGAGLAAAAASFVQLSLVLRIERHITRGVGTRQTDVLFDTLSRTGAVKLLLLAVAVGAASVLVAHAGTFPRWVPWVGYVVVPVLTLAAVATVTRGPALHTVLTLSLPVLMLWVAAASFVLYRCPVDLRHA
jgi:hypothetical protein